MTHPQIPGKLMTEQDSHSNLGLATGPKVEDMAPSRQGLCSEAQLPTNGIIRPLHAGVLATLRHQATSELCGAHSVQRTAKQGCPLRGMFLRLRSSGPRTQGCMSQALGQGGGDQGCLVFKPQTTPFQNYPPQCMQKANTSSISFLWSLMRRP